MTIHRDNIDTIYIKKKKWRGLTGIEKWVDELNQYKETKTLPKRE